MRSLSGNGADHYWEALCEITDHSHWVHHQHTFMELVEDVESETGEDITVGKVLPEWLDGTQSLSCVLCTADTLSPN